MSTSSAAFTQLFAENQSDPQWITMIQSLVNYKQKLVEKETKNVTHSVVLRKSIVRTLFLNRYKVHTIRGVQYIREKHLTGVLNPSKMLKSDVERGFIELSHLVDWIVKEDKRIKKIWLKENL